MTRQAIFNEINTERMAQDSRWGGPERDDKHSYAEWLAIIIRHLGLAAGDKAEIDPERYRKQLLRTAAVAIAAVESHDRKTGRQVVAGQHVTGSGH